VQVTGVDFLPSGTLIHLHANGANNVYQGMLFELVHQDSGSTSLVGMKSMQIDKEDPNSAVVVFPKVDSRKTWILESYGMTTVSGFRLKVPLNVGK
jgi:hypothetical protein